ncbi:MAG: hypothetical protein WD735_01400 [Balneolaceae bacterium]
MKKRELLDLFFGTLLVTAGAGLLLGLYTGLIRLGLALPTAFDLGAMSHGPLMINGFLATLISLERGAALEKLWSYVAPFSFVIATVLLLTGFFYSGGYFLLTGSLFLLLIMGYLCYLQRVVHHFIMAAGAAVLFIGNLLFVLNYPVYDLIGWWIAFPLLTIFGERLELNRIMRPSKKAQRLFAALIMIWIISLVSVHLNRDFGWQFNSVLLIGIALWLIQYDVARKTIKSKEWTRYSAWCLLTGYGWLIIAGVTGIIYGLPRAGFIYDAQLHIFFVGFVFSMIFAHAAIIIPALTGKLVPWNRYFYLPFYLLHGFLILRVIGDLFYLTELRLIGSYGNVAAILLFLAGILTQILRQSNKTAQKVSG